MVVHIINPNTGGRGRLISEFEASMVYRARSRTARAVTERNHVSKGEELVPGGTDFLSCSILPKPLLVAADLLASWDSSCLRFSHCIECKTTGLYLQVMLTHPSMNLTHSMVTRNN